MESDINKDIDNMINMCNKAVYNYKVALARFGKQDSIQYFDDACKSVGDFEALLKKIQDRFGTLLQADPTENKN